MAPKQARKRIAPDTPAQLDGQLSIDAALEAIERAPGREEPDWTALDQFQLGELCEAIVSADAGVMLRSADRGRAISVGVFVAGRSQWTTCADQRDLLAILDACSKQLVGIAGAARAFAPTRKGRRAVRGS